MWRWGQGTLHPHGIRFVKPGGDICIALHWEKTIFIMNVTRTSIVHMTVISVVLIIFGSVNIQQDKTRLFTEETFTWNETLFEWTIFVSQALLFWTSGKPSFTRKTSDKTYIYGVWYVCRQIQPNMNKYLRKMFPKHFPPCRPV